MHGSLVDRAVELESLGQFLTRALDGDGGLCFVAGEAGAGKTTLLAEFARQAHERDEDLVVGVGSCDAQTGIGDAFLPFREILELLTGDVDSKLAQGRVTDEGAGRIRRIIGLCAEAVVELGPDLIGAVVPGASLLASAGMFAASKTPWVETLQKRMERPNKAADINQNQIFEQYVKVLEKLSKTAPLVLVIDDLQWADTASIGLLFRLSRRLENSRTLVIGLYRPSDVALGRDGERHPLEAVLNEVRRYRGDVEIVLESGGERGRAFVDQFLDLEENNLDEEFRQALHERTGGHPLFTVELLRALQDRGDLERDASGRWITTTHLDWNDLPSRVEGVIEERLHRLDEALRRSLQIAAVEGESFTAEVVSTVQPVALRSLIVDLSDTLQKRHELVRASGIERLGSSRLSRYRFSHNLMQSYLLDHLDEVESSFLHEDVGLAIESLHAAGADVVAVQLARHFDIAGVAEKAFEYSKMAGDRAMEVFANQEALAHYDRALAWATDDLDRFSVLLALIEVHTIAADLERRRADLEALGEVADRTGNQAHLAELSLQRARFENDAGNYDGAVAAAHRAVELFRDLGDEAGEASSHLAAGFALRSRADYSEGIEECQLALSQARAAGRHDLEGGALANLGIIADLKGERDRSRAFFEEAVAAHQNANNPSSTARALANLGVAKWRDNDLDGALDALNESLVQARRVGARLPEGIALSNLAMVWEDKGDLDQAKQSIEAGLTVIRDVGSPYALARSLGLLASVLTAQGDYGGAWRAREEALDVDRSYGDRQDEAHQIEALAGLERRIGRYEASERLYRESMALAEEIGDRDAVSKCLQGLAAMHLENGQPEDALEYAGEALSLARELGDQEGESRSLVITGHAQMALDDLDAAELTYTTAEKLGVLGLAPSTAAGLCHVSYRRGDYASGLTLIEPLLQRLLRRETDGIEEIFRLYLTARIALESTGDPRLEELVRAAEATLADFAARLVDDDARRSFLEGVRVNRLLATGEYSAAS